MQLKAYPFFIVLLFSLILPIGVGAQELHQDEQAVWRAQVREVVSQDEELIPGTGTTHVIQSLRAEILEGPQKGEVVSFENDYIALEEGDSFYMNYLVTINGNEIYSVREKDRRGALLILTLVFVGAVIALGRWQGVRSLLALAGSFFAIFYILLPGLFAGWNPLFASFLVAGGILFAAIYFTHGFNMESNVAFGGTMIAVILTGIFALIAVHITDLTGFTSDDAVYLNFSTQGALDFTGLLLGGIIIGVLGVLDDIAVTQSAVVAELFSANPDLGRSEVYAKALRVGREHVGALVNTLVLAYTGTALPLLLLFYGSSETFMTVINREMFSAEIVRTLAGSTGLILTVPIVTALAVFFLKDAPRRKGAHHHGHHH